MATTTATVIFTGLVYLAALPQAQPPILQASIITSPNDRVSTRGGSIPRHATFIKVAEKFVDKGYTNRIADFEFTVKNKTFFVYLLKGETIKISGFENSALQFLPPSGN